MWPFESNHDADVAALIISVNSVTRISSVAGLWFYAQTANKDLTLECLKKQAHKAQLQCLLPGMWPPLAGLFIRNTALRDTPHLNGPITLDVGLDPVQPVRVLLLPHALVDLGAQLLSPLQRLLQGAAVGVALRSVFQDLREERKRRSSEGGHGLSLPIRRKLFCTLIRYLGCND